MGDRPNHASSSVRRRTFLKATGAGVGLATLAGCSGLGLGGGSSDTIVIAGLEPQSGVYSVYGPRHLRGARYAVEQINADGGVLDRELEIQAVDTESDAQTAVNAFTRLIEQEGAVVGMGLVNSNAAIQTANLAEEREVPQLLHAAGSSEIIPNKDRRYTFRTALPPAQMAARSIGQIIEDQGYTNIGAIYMDAAWGRSFQQGVEAFFPDGLEFTTGEAPIPQTDFVPQLRQMPDDVEVILGTAHPAGITSMYPQVLELGLDIDLFTGAITAMEADFGAVGEGIGEAFVSFNGLDLYTDGFREVAVDFNETTDGFFDTAQANGYVAVNLIADAIEESGDATGPDISAGLRNGSFDTLYASSPLEYADWGEIDGAIQVFNAFDVGEGPSYYPDAGFTPEEYFRTDPLPPFDPEEFN